MKVRNPRRVIGEIKKQNIEELYKYFLNDLEVDILEKRRNEMLPELRSLFNVLLKRKHKLKINQIVRFYEEKGCKFTHGTIINSISKFKRYKKEMPELETLFNNLFKGYRREETPIINIDKRDLTPLQKLVDNLYDWQEKELKELIELRIKSWDWKNNDSVKIYTAIG